MAVRVGAVAGVLVTFAAPLLDKLKLDDPVGALSVHPVNGDWGTLAVGICNPAVPVMDQLTGGVLVGAFTCGASFSVWLAGKASFGLRMTEQEEVAGIDRHQFGSQVCSLQTQSYPVQSSHPRTPRTPRRRRPPHDRAGVAAGPDLPRSSRCGATAASRRGPPAVARRASGGPAHGRWAPQAAAAARGPATAGA